MLLRLVVVVAAGLFVAACAQPANEATPLPPRIPIVGDSVPPDRWRAVLVAGDNTSPAFDNGVEAMRDRLVGAGIRDIKLYSSNRDRAGANGLASSANVRDALRAGTGQACLAFVTSHGEQQGFFLRTDRRLFGPALLDQALTAGCGDVPTVVVVSACHSGTFIDDRMRKPNRIIMTAARIDRTSFGCGASDQYTYYDRCLLQQFDAATTWRGLALAAQTCVETLERQLGIRQVSLPQLFVGAGVADLRLPGR